MHKNNHYSPEFKIQIVKEYLEGGVSHESLIKKYNIKDTRQTRDWVKKYQEFGESSFYEEKRGRKSTGRPKDYNKMTDAEKVKYLEMENAVLKKVIALTQKT